MSRISLKNVSKQFGTVQVIESLNLEIAHGEFVVVIGPSGCGKSTLLRLIAGLEDLSGGDIFIDGEVVNDVPAKSRGVAMVFQSYALYPHMTVAENIAFSLKMAKVSKAEIKAAVDGTAATLQLSELLERYPKQLSGGQRQRVAIGRAIVRRPGVFLFDEPLSNLDAALRAQTRLEIADLHRDIGGTSVYVTHDQIEAMTLADRIVVLNQGKIEQTGSPLEIYRNPANLFVAKFIGTPKINVLPATLTAHEDPQTAVLDIGGQRVNIRHSPPRIDGDVLVGLRAENIALAERREDGHLRGTVRHIERLGESSLVHVELSDGVTVVARDYNDCDVRSGAEVFLRIDWSRALFFDTDGNAVSGESPQ
jgi:ABC-type sugar transport system ATPase subunit